MSELAWPYLIVVLLCLFWLLGSGLQRRMSSDGKKGGPHAAWRISEDESPLRRFWQAPRKRRRS